MTLAEYARQIGGTVVGDGSVEIERIAAIDDVDDRALTFAVDERYLRTALAYAINTAATAKAVELIVGSYWYAQDAMSLRPNLTVTLGIRHEFNNGWNSPNGVASNFVFGSNGVLLTQPVVGTSVYSENNARFLFGPRVGIAWAPFGSQTKTTIHAGFGLYYEQLDYMGNCCDAATSPT